MAGGASGIDEDEQGVGVAVVADVDHFLRIAGGRSFVPQLLAGSAPENGFASLFG